MHRAPTPTLALTMAALLSTLPLGACTSDQHRRSDPPMIHHEVAQIEAMLNDWHDAASKADEARYFGHMTSNAVFIGTDDTEYWTGPQFKDFAHPYFSKGKGWTYHPHDRHVYWYDPATDVAWFDEKLDNDKYGRCRGAGVCVRTGGEWKLAHYTLSFPVPNDAAADVVRTIKQFEAAASPAK